MSHTCYSRSVLLGCKQPYLNFEKRLLEEWFAIAFGLVPLHISVTVAGLLCSNHVTNRFGKGMMPMAYRLSKSGMKEIMEKYARQIIQLPWFLPVLT